MASQEQHTFQAEVAQLLDLMVHSLYSNADIFLRELISNASDALDRLRFEQLTRPELQSSAELQIQLSPDAQARTLSVSDNGIGMSRDDVLANLGTIARSGTKEFLKAMREANGELPPEMIGQFGVGFYSSFIVAESVTVVTRRAGEDKATRWVSRGDGNFTIEETERSQHGTTVTVQLKPADEENGVQDYSNPVVLRRIVKRHSDFVRYPIRMPVWREDPETKTQVREDETLNSMEAIWAKPKDKVSDEDYADFYRHIAHDWNPPLRHIPVRMEGTFEAQALLYIPKTTPLDLYHPEMKRGLQLYVKRVFIMDECRELMPGWLRFIKGVVDAQDLPLNVSREILQRNRQIALIRKQLVKKVLDALEELRSEAREDYEAFWTSFGPVLKEGLVSPETKESDRLLQLMMAHSTHKDGALTSLAEYIGRKPADQEVIYYLTGPSLDAVRASPHLERVVARGYEVLLLTDPIDEIWLERGLTFEDHKLVSVSRGDLELGTDEERKESQEKLKAQEGEYRNLLTRLRVVLQDEVKEVRLSARLTDSPACLVADEGDLTPQMEHLLRQMGKELPKTKRILELNPEHGVFSRLRELFEADEKSEILADYAELLYGQALLAEGALPADPARFGQLVANLMVGRADDGGSTAQK